jgi:GNAT superfamily N-acetyltransferase
VFHAKPTELRDAARSLGGLGKLIELFRIEGPVIFIKHALQRYASPLFSRIYFFEFDLSQATQLKSPAELLPEGVSVSILTGDGESGRLKKILAQAEVAPSSVERRVTLGDVAIIAMAGEELVGYSWATFKERWISEIGASIVPREGETLMYDKRIMPQWRGKGLQYALSVAMLLYLSQLGWKRALVWVDVLNTRSLKNQRRLGKRKVAYVISSPALGILRVRDFSPSDCITIRKNEHLKP